MKNIHDYTIEQLKISPFNIKMEDEEWIRQTIRKLASGHKKGETEIEVFKQFASDLEHQFKAQISTFSPPSEDYRYWKLHLPKDGNLMLHLQGSLCHFISNVLRIPKLTEL